MKNFWRRSRAAADSSADARTSRDPYAQHRVDVAIRLASSPAYSDRLTAGHLLAEEAGDEDIDAILRRLLLDPDDTAVTFATAVDLLDRHDLSGMVLALEAWRDADDDTGGHLGDAFLDVCNDPDADRATFHAELRAVRAACPQLAAVADDVAAWLGFDSTEDEDPAG